MAAQNLLSRGFLFLVGTIVLRLQPNSGGFIHLARPSVCRSPLHQLLAKLFLTCYGRPGHPGLFLLLFPWSALSAPSSSWSWPDFSPPLWAAMVCTVHRAVWMWFCIRAGSYLRSPWYHPGWAAGVPSLAGSCQHSQYMLEEHRDTALGHCTPSHPVSPLPQGCPRTCPIATTNTPLSHCLAAPCPTAEQSQADGFSPCRNSASRAILSHHPAHQHVWGLIHPQPSVKEEKKQLIQVQELALAGAAGAAWNRARQGQ